MVKDRAEQIDERGEEEEEAKKVMRGRRASEWCAGIKKSRGSGE